MWRSPYPREDWEEKRRYSPRSSVEDQSSDSSIKPIFKYRQSNKPFRVLIPLEDSEEEEATSSLPDLIIEREHNRVDSELTDKEFYDKLEIAVRKHMKYLKNSELVDCEDKSTRLSDPGRSDKVESNADDNLDTNMSEDSRYNSCFHIDSENEEVHLHSFEDDSTNIDMNLLSTIEEVTEDDIADIRANTEHDEDETFRIDDEIRGLFNDKTELRLHSRTFTEKSDDIPSKDSVNEFQSIEVVVEIHSENECREAVQLIDNDQASSDSTEALDNIDDHEMSEIEAVRDVVEPANPRTYDSIHVLDDAEEETIEEISLPSGLNEKRSLSLPDNVVDDEVMGKEKRRKRSRGPDASTDNVIDDEVNIECSPPKQRKKSVEPSATQRVGVKLTDKRSKYTQTSLNTKCGSSCSNQSKKSTGTQTSHATENNNCYFFFSPVITNFYTCRI